MKTTKYFPINKGWQIKSLVIALLLGTFVFPSFAQLTPRPNLGVKGQYDVKMVSGQVLQSVWLSATNPYTAIRPLTDDEMARDYTCLNNETAIGKQAFSATGTLLATKPINAVDISQIYADCDDDMTTWQSSAAYLDFGSGNGCTTIYKAYLYWTSFAGASSTTSYAAHVGVGPTLKSMPANSNEGLGGTAYQTVLFKAPGDKQYSTIKADRTDVNPQASGERKVCFADVTKYVKGKGNGLYWLANVHSGTGTGNGGAAAGWTLVVIFTPPNCPPRTIKFWDGMYEIGSGSSMPIGFTFSAGEVPASSNSISYLGIAVLDGENTATYLSSKPAAPEFLEFSSKSPTVTGSVFKINPFAPGQTAPFVGEPQACYPTYSKAGLQYSACAYDGFSCSRISTYDADSAKNGVALTRIPNQRNTLGYDAHHLRLPTGAVVPNATSVNMTYYAGPQGGTAPYMAYMAIQTLQPDLKLYLRAENSATAPGGKLTYVLRVENIGPLASKASTNLYSIVSDTLPKMLDFVPGSIQYVRGSAPLPPETNNVGSDVNENLKFYLPSIAAGNGITATDSVVIKFDVQLKDLSRTDIWAYGCNRTVYNRASIVYKADDNSDLTGGSNSTGGCDGQGSYYNTPVSSADLDAQYIKTHKDTLLLTKEVNAAIKNGTKLYIVQTIKDSLAKQLTILNLPTTDVTKYTVYNDAGIAVGATEAFTQTEAYQTYTAEADLGDGCIETFTFTCLVAKVPGYTIDASTIKTPKYVGDASGEISLKVYDGTAPYTINIYDETGNVVYTSSSATDNTFSVNTLKAGKYTFTISDQGSIPSNGSFSITDPDPFKVSLGNDTSKCTGTPIDLNAKVDGRTGGIVYKWEKTTENLPTATSIWTTVTGAVNSASTLKSTLNITVDQTTYYKVTACDGYSTAIDTIKVTANPIPGVTLNSDASVSVTVNPTVPFTTTVTNAVGAIRYHWTMSTDNGTSWNELPWRTRGTYTFAPDSSSVSVSNIDTLMTGYKYRVDVTDKSTTCSSTYSTVTLTVTNGPAVGSVSTKPSCFGKTDGQLAIHISGGEPGETYSITFTGPSPNMPSPVTYLAGPTAVADISITGPAGTYSAELNPVSGPYPGLPIQNKVFTIEDQAPVSLTLSSDNYEVCAGNSINLTANLTGGPDGATKTYIWEQSTDNGGSYSPIAGTASNIPFALDKSSVFRVIGMVGTCPDTSNTVAVAALPTPKASIVAVTDTGCYSFDLHNLQVVETTGINDYTVTLHSAAPKNTNDNRYLIPESDYIVTKNMTVYARLTVGGLCSSTAAGNIYIKKMDQCYPIVVPEFFSPDGDGINDLFQIDNLQAYDNPEIVVYDRYGKQVFKGGKEALTPPNGWDGKYISKDLPSGDYWYEMKFKEIKTKVGHFSIKRRKE
jgi:gliding motility-associated-like protein